MGTRAILQLQESGEGGAGFESGDEEEAGHVFELN
jgi:hypothetical protein